VIEEKRLVPKRRFSGFEEEWNSLLLGNHSIIKGRLGWKNLRREEYVNKGPSMIAGRHIQNGIINWNEVDHIPLWRYEESPEIMLEKNDVVFSKDGTLGNPAILRELKGKATINATMMLVRVKKELHPEFFYQILNSKYFSELIRLKVSGSSIPHLFQGDMNNFSFYGPSIQEQQKIGEFFKVLDERIANQERKIAKVKALKEAYLTEMFPQEGETVPKRRFKGFEGEWELLCLKDVGNSYYGGGTPRTSTPNYWNGHIPWIQSSDLKEDQVWVKQVKNTITQDGLQNSATKLIPANSIAVVTRVGVGKLGFIPYEYTTSQDFLSISNLNISHKFAVYAMYKLLKREKTSVQGTSIKGMTNEELLSLKLHIPKDKNEQQKIGSFFKNLDDQIRAEEAKLEKLKKMKEAYLEEMFV